VNYKYQRLPIVWICNICAAKPESPLKNMLLSNYMNILKHAFEIPQTSDDNREKLQVVELFKDTYLVKLELHSKWDSKTELVNQ
jgi:hypothetical protein